MDMPTNKQIALMAQAAFDGANAKAVELGLDRIDSLLGIERAYNAAVRAMEIIDAIGPDLAAILGEGLMRAEAEKVYNEAEGVINGGE